MGWDNKDSERYDWKCTDWQEAAFVFVSADCSVGKVDTDRSLYWGWLTVNEVPTVKLSTGNSEGGTGDIPVLPSVSWSTSDSSLTQKLCRPAEASSWADDAGEISPDMIFAVCCIFRSIVSTEMSKEWTCDMTGVRNRGKVFLGKKWLSGIIWLLRKPGGGFV